MIAGLISGLFGLFVKIVGGLISLVLFVFCVAMLIHALTNRALQGIEKLIWVVVIIFLPVIGSLIYFFVGRKQGVLT